MSTVKISELVQLQNLGANTSATDILAVDRANNITGRVTATTLSRYLYANNILNVGNNALVLPNVAAQFAGRSNNYLQMNFVNNASNGSTDFVITADVGTDETHYLDLGYNNSNYNYDGFTFAAPLDGYLMIAGNDADPGGNLIIGTYNENRDLTVSLGSISTDGHFARFKYNTGLQLLTKPLFFADGTSQNTAAEPANYTQAAFLKANTVNTYAYAANTWAQANVGAALAAAKVYSDTYTMVASNAFTTTANTWLQANDATTLAAAKSYADGLNAAQLNTAFSYTDSAFAKANVALDFANGAFSKANTTATNLVITNSLASGAYTLAVAANTTGSAAFDKANNALANTTGTLAGALRITGNVIVGETIVFKDNTEMRYNPSASPACFLISSANAIQVKAGSKVFDFGNDGNFSLPRDLGVTGNTSIGGDLTLTGGSLTAAGNMTVNGTMVLANSNFTPTESAITIKATANIALPVNDGYMIHISGKNGVPSRIVSDSYGTGAYSVFASRTARGNVDYPAAVQTGDIIGRFSSNGYGATKFQQFGTGRIDFVATENYTDANTGSQIKFWNCPVGSNTLTNILNLNGDSAEFTGVLSPEKGFKLTPNTRPGITNTLNINFTTDSLYKITIDNTATINLSNYTIGKIVEVWITNSSGANRVVTHGCLATNSTTNATTFTLAATSSAYLKYFSIDGDNANTFVAVTYA
jgi:hypothetical protein